MKTDAFLCTGSSNVRYLTGFTGSNGAALITSNDSWFFTDFRYKTQSAEQVRNARIVVTRPSTGLLKAVAAQAKKLRLQTIAFEAAQVTVAQLEDAKKSFQRIALVSTRDLVEKLRMVKDENELALIRRAVGIADRAYEQILGYLRPGRAEREIARELERRMLALGADGLGFEIIVVSGVRSALPHGRATDKRIERGDLVTLDFGAQVGGYRSDCTRTVCVGKPTAEQQRIYKLVRDAHRLAESRICAGASCREIDGLARGVIDCAGYKENFGHGLGHSVGLDIHESPRFSRTGKGRLKANMVMTVEPGVYIENWGGVRIEDLVIVQNDGVEVVTQAPNPPRLPVV